jgi:thiamine-phosphate pyrophosphorylase
LAAKERKKRKKKRSHFQSLCVLCVLLRLIFSSALGMLRMPEIKGLFLFLHPELVEGSASGECGISMSSLEQRRRQLVPARLYAIVDTGYVELDRVPYVTEQLVLGDVDLIQLRAKKLPLAAIAELGKTMRKLIPSSGPLFVLNDHPELVGEIGADCIHVGQDDLSVAEARKQAGAEVLVGKSTHSLDQAIAAEKEGADYIGVGPIFATPTKPDYVPVGPALIGQVRTAVRVPQFCIGGINEDTLPEVLAAGARRVVIVSALLKSSDIPAYCRRVREKLDEIST